MFIRLSLMYSLHHKAFLNPLKKMQFRNPFSDNAFLLFSIPVLYRRWSSLGCFFICPMLSMHCLCQFSWRPLRDSHHRRIFQWIAGGKLHCLCACCTHVIASVLSPTAFSYIRVPISKESPNRIQTGRELTSVWQEKQTACGIKSHRSNEHFF